MSCVVATELAYEMRWTRI